MKLMELAPGGEHGHTHGEPGDIATAFEVGRSIAISSCEEDAQNYHQGEIQQQRDVIRCVHRTAWTEEGAVDRCTVLLVPGTAEQIQPVPVG